MKPLRHPWYQRLLIAAGVGAFTAGAAYGQIFWQLDDALYDRLVGSWNYPADPQLVIVVIDDRSLQQLGQWPWPRSTHARLIERLSDAGVRRIALDLMFPEPDRKDPSQDAELAAMIRGSGNVLLPVMAAAPRSDAVPEELLPIPALATAAAKMGHTDIDVEADGVARGIYLKAGLGTPRWPALGLALADVRPPGSGLQDNRSDAPSPYRWYRNDYVRMRYAGPPGSFAQVSYIDVLNGEVPQQLLRDHLVIVGMTASGIAPRLLTPTSKEQWMSGSEYQANVASMLLNGKTIIPLTPAMQALISGLLAMLSVWMLSLPHPGRIVCAALPVPLMLSMAGLWGLNLWFAPAAAMVGILLVLATWISRQTAHWRRHADRDPLTGLANRRRFDEVLRRQYDSCWRQRRPLTLVFIDVDNFKQYNDTHGHHVGDRVLRQVAEMFAERARRAGDLAARFGGDEFAMVLPDTSRDGAVNIVEALVAEVRRMSITQDGGKPARASISVGVYTAIPEIENDTRRFIEGADAALYTAKAAGRDGYFAGPLNDS